MADVKTAKVPPLPQLVPPMVSMEIKSTVDFSKARFNNPWMQWFTQVKYKIDTIDTNLVSVGAVDGAGFVIRNLDGTWVQYSDPLEIVHGGTSATDADTARDNLGAQKKVGAESLSATGGSATALPAQPVGYVEIDVGGTTRKIAYYD